MIRYTYFLVLIALLSFNSLFAQMDEHKKRLIEANHSFSAAVELTISSSSQKQKLTGSYTINKRFQYLKLSTTEFFKFKGHDIKVANAERKIAYSKTTKEEPQSNYFIDLGTLAMLYYPTQISETASGFILHLIPLDSSKNVLGEMYIRTDQKYKVESIKTIMPIGHPFGIKSVIIVYSKRNEQTDRTHDPNNFFTIQNDSLKILNRYTNYTIL